jgi:hypothetical protein
MAQIPMHPARNLRLVRNLGFLLEAGGEFLETVGQCQKLLPAARLEAQLVRYSPQRFGDAAEIRNPGLWLALIHRSAAFRLLPTC